MKIEKWIITLALWAHAFLFSGILIAAKIRIAGATLSIHPRNAMGEFAMWLLALLSLVSAIALPGRKAIFSWISTGIFSILSLSFAYFFFKTGSAIYPLLTVSLLETGFAAFSLRGLCHLYQIKF